MYRRNIDHRNLKRISFISGTVTRFILAVLLVLSALLSLSCGNSETRVLYSRSSTGDQLCASYELLDGIDKKTFMADAGDNLMFSYFSEVEKGILKMEVLNPDKERVLSFNSNKSGTQGLQVEKTGKYTIQVTGNQTKGSYQITWVWKN